VSVQVNGPEVSALPSWHVVFVDSNCPVWWHWPLKKGFRHCWAFAWDERADRWIVVDPLFDVVFVRCLSDAEILTMMRMIRERGGRIVHSKVAFEVKRRPRLLLTCVTAIEAMLGLSACALTPHRLYRHLLARGGVEIGG
jgi:hypothetical protein